jgi:hypothetical protein
MLPAHPKRGLDDSVDEMLCTQELPTKRRRQEYPALSPTAAAHSPSFIPESQDLDLDASVSLPDAIEMPSGDAVRKRRHSGDGTASDEEAEADDAPARQRRQTTNPGFRLVIPEGLTRTIPSVVLEDRPPSDLERRGPTIEEIPYNALAIVPYTGPPPEVALPAEVCGSQDDGSGTPRAAETPLPLSQGMDTEDSGVIQMLTPLECGSMDRMGSAASMDIDNAA